MVEGVIPEDEAIDADGGRWKTAAPLDCCNNTNDELLLITAERVEFEGRVRMMDGTSQRIDNGRAEDSLM